jgi:magnesium transporter
VTAPGQETAARHLSRAVPTARPSDTVAVALARLREGDLDTAEIVCITDASERLVGVARLTDLLAAPDAAAVADRMLAEIPTVRPEDDQEHVAGVAVAHALPAVPVVDAGGRLEGVVPAAALIAILRREHVEDLHRLAGIQSESLHAREAIEGPPARRLRDRLPWLLVGLAGSMVATFVVSRFEEMLASRVAIAFFVPGIVYIADAIGTQTETIAVRGLSLSPAPFGRLLAGEIRTGALIGLCLGAIALPLVLLAFGDARLALAVAVAVLCTGTVATGIGLLLPWLLALRGSDPAFGSGPVATIIQDVLSLLIYFWVVSLLLR